MRRRLLLVLLPLLTALLGGADGAARADVRGAADAGSVHRYLARAEVYSALAEPILRNNRELAAVEHRAAGDHA